MNPLTNYLQPARKDHVLTQDEVGYLLGSGGPAAMEKVSRHENFVREPSLRDALAYQAIYGKPVSELFAGLYRQVQGEVQARAKYLSFRKLRKPNARKQQTITRLANLANLNPPKP
jgi:hypothetical protein